MINAPYTKLSAIYSHLMRLIGYRDWAKYILSLAEYLEISPDKVLEIAAGNGIIGSKLMKSFNFFVLSDRSKEMLELAPGKYPPRVCCDMTALPFKSKFDFIFSTFDSINYLTTTDSVLLLFKEIESILSSRGFFTFDVSLRQNSIIHEDKLNRQGTYKGYKYTQKSRFDRDNSIHLNEFIIEDKSGKVFLEKHVQRIYSFEEYFEMIEKTGLYISDCFNTFTFENADEKSGRIQFIIRKRRDAEN
jgi:ubiquinone/menaquinone biosynthesis C-methylase UbiE